VVRSDEMLDLAQHLGHHVGLHRQPQHLIGWEWSEVGWWVVAVVVVVQGSASTLEVDTTCSLLLVAS
jgi:hypothetical protein